MDSINISLFLELLLLAPPQLESAPPPPLESAEEEGSTYTLFFLNFELRPPISLVQII